MPAAMKNMVALAVIFIISLVEAVPYTKYGRTCKDIGCPSNEICIMAEDPCTYNSRSNCGRFPTCSKAGAGEQTCRTLICPSGQYCKTDNGRPVCVSASQSLEYDSAGVSSVNGQTTNMQDHRPHNTNSDPFENANAPPAEDVFGSPAKPYHPVDSGSNSNLGYPPYPGTGNTHPSGSNNGYPNYGNNQPPPRNDGYPPYPTNNRMPVSGQANNPYGQPGSPYGQPGSPYGQPNYPYGQYPPGYPQQPTNGQRNPAYPNYPPSNYPSPNYPQTNTRNYNSGFRRNSGISLGSSMMITTICFGLLTIFRIGLLS